MDSRLRGNDSGYPVHVFRVRDTRVKVGLIFRRYNAHASKLV
jgi:hypothetical protein